MPTFVTLLRLIRCVTFDAGSNIVAGDIVVNYHLGDVRILGNNIRILLGESVKEVLAIRL